MAAATASFTARMSSRGCRPRPRPTHHATKAPRSASPANRVDDWPVIDVVDREARGNENLDGALSIGDDEPTHAAGGDVVHGVEGIGVGRDESEIADGRQLGSTTTSVSGPAASTSARGARHRCDDEAE